MPDPPKPALPPKKSPLLVEEIRASITPLRLIFWGGLLCVIDFNLSYTTNGSGFRFDVLNDAVGMAMIVYAVWALSQAPVSEAYGRKMVVVKIVAILGLLEALRGHFIFNYGDASTVFNLWANLLNLASLAAIILFCLAMREFCQAADLLDPAESWRTSTILFVVIYALPLGLLYSGILLAIVTGASFHFNLGPIGLLVIPVLLVPLIHLFVSTSRMQRASQAIGWE